jgi:hypothetical protein
MVNTSKPVGAGGARFVAAFFRIDGSEEAASEAEVDVVEEDEDEVNCGLCNKSVKQRSTESAALKKLPCDASKVAAESSDLARVSDWVRFM